MRGCLPPFCFVLCKMQGKEKTYQQARVAIWLVCIHLLPNGGQGWFSIKCIALPHEPSWPERSNLLA